MDVIAEAYVERDPNTIDVMELVEKRPWSALACFAVSIYIVKNFEDFKAFYFLFV